MAVKKTKKAAKRQSTSVKTQVSFDLSMEVPIEVNGEYRSLSGNMTFMPSGKTPNGSFSLKIKSGMLSHDPEEKKAVLDAAMTALEESYDDLLQMIDDETDRQLSAGGQTHMQGELDKSMKRGFKEEDKPSSSSAA